MIAEVTITYDSARRMFMADASYFPSKLFDENKDRLVAAAKKEAIKYYPPPVSIIITHKWKEKDIIHGVREEGNIMPRKFRKKAKSKLMIDILPSSFTIHMPNFKDWLYVTTI